MDSNSNGRLLAASCLSHATGCHLNRAYVEKDAPCPLRGEECPGIHGRCAGAYDVPVEGDSELPRVNSIQPALNTVRHGALGLRPSSVLPLCISHCGPIPRGTPDASRAGVNWKARLTEARKGMGVTSNARYPYRSLRTASYSEASVACPSTVPHRDSSRLPGMSFWRTLTTRAVRSWKRGVVWRDAVGGRRGRIGDGPGRGVTGGYMMGQGGITYAPDVDVVIPSCARLLPYLPATLTASPRLGLGFA